MRRARWLRWVLAFLPVLLAEVFFPCPALLLPLPGIAAAVLAGEGSVVFALVAGAVQLLLPGALSPFFLVPAVAFALTAALLSRRLLRSDVLTYLLMALLCLVTTEGLRCTSHLTGAPAGALLHLALPELGLSLLCAIPVYGLFWAAGRGNAP